MSFLSRILSQPGFSDAVEHEINAQLIGRPCTGYPDGAPTPGILMDHELTAPLVFGVPREDGLRFRIPFETRAVASGQCKTSEATDYTWSRDHQPHGIVDVEFPPDALLAERMEEILQGMILEVQLEDPEIDDTIPSSGPVEKFAGES